MLVDDRAYCVQIVTSSDARLECSLGRDSLMLTAQTPPAAVGVHPFSARPRCESSWSTGLTTRSEILILLVEKYCGGLCLGI